ncbi:MAG: emp24/gp25L/p24 family protein, partial [Kiritimatiellaceae bacterium]|nr:emp24/gp25L/p24 family protein [Kiritimatiellaceae bacterium]
STNSGARRMLHLFRKEKNEKRLWIGMLIVIVTLLVVTALWQFWYLDYVARKEEQKKVLHMPPAQSSVPAPSAAE